LENSISNGIVSGKRTREGVLLLQTTAPISPGNSGGGLFDAQGKLIGITTFKLKNGENINFAVEAQYVTRLHDVMIPTGVLRAYAEIFKDPNTVESADPANALIISEHGQALINSKALPKWLISERAADGRYVYESLLLNISSEVAAPILRSFLNSQKTINPEIIEPKKDIKKLVCHLVSTGSDGKSTDGVFLIDFSTRKVNGDDASISDSYIEWKMKGRWKFVLNRYTGILTAGNDESTLYSGSCAPAGEKKF